MTTNASSKPADKQEFGNVLRFLRIKQGLSHVDLATRVGESQDLIKDWEGSRATPTVAQVKRLCGTLPKVRHFLHTLPLGYDRLLAGAKAEEFGFRPINTLADIDKDDDDLRKDIAELKQTSFTKTFGGYLRYYRLEQGLSQDELGNLVGVSGQAVSAWEADLASPVRDNYDKLLSLYPKLKDAPEPPMLSRPMPDGGKGQPKVKVTTWRDKMLAAIGMAPPEFKAIASALKRSVEDEVGAKQFQEELDGFINWAKSLKQHLPVSVVNHQRSWPSPANDTSVVEPVSLEKPTAEIPATPPVRVLVPTLPTKLDYEPMPLPEGAGLTGCGMRYAVAMANLEKAQNLKESTKALFEEATIYHDLAQEAVNTQHQQLLDEAKKSKG